MEALIKVLTGRASGLLAHCCGAPVKSGGPSRSKIDAQTRKHFLSQAVLVGVFASGVGLSWLLALQPASAQQLTEATLVKTYMIPTGSEDATRTYFGEVSARETVPMGFQVSGRMIEFHAPEGEIIPKGATIGRLDPVPFEIAIERAQLQLQQAERQLSRFQRLAGSTVSDAQLQDAETDARLAAVMLRDAEYAFDQSTLEAPFDALVAGRTVANFSTVAAGAEIVRLHDMSELRIDIEVPEALVQQLGVDPEVILHARFPGSDKRYPLDFREMNTEVTEVGQTFRVTLAFDAPPDRLLFPGASAVVEATLVGPDVGPVIPAAAVAADPDGQPFVFEINENDGRLVLERRDVVLGVSVQGNVVVREGLSRGAELVVGGLSTLREGLTVRRFVPNF